MPETRPKDVAYEGGLVMALFVLIGRVLVGLVVAVPLVWVLRIMFRLSFASGMGGTLGVVMGLLIAYGDQKLKTQSQYESGTVDRRQPQKHRWLSNRLRPRRMHWGPRRLF